MTLAPQSDTYQRSVLEFKSSTLTVPVLALADNNLAAIENQLTIKINQAPEFFKNSPIIVDLSKINSKKLNIDLNGVFDLVLNANLQLIGIRGGNEVINQQAKELKIALLADERKHAPKKQTISAIEEVAQPEPSTNHSTETPTPSKVNTKIISQPVRSGQKIYAHGDLIILAAVSAGAEIMAEGNIHVYGALRGRALAGIKGDESCRIFCSDLQAELLSIAGNYQVNDNLKDTEIGKPVQVLLDKQKLIINEL